MAWVKRNLIFLIIIAVGLGSHRVWRVSSVCGVLGANQGISSEYSSTVDQVQTLQKATPPPTKENIDAAKADQKRVEQFLTTFKKAFAPFPTAPTVDDRGFVEHLALMLRQFGMEATNNGVQLPNDYYFSFSEQRQNVRFSAECLDPLMQEMEEVKIILRILYAAKINYLENLQRIPACQDDNSGEDCLYTSSISNQWGLVTPYKVTFRGFSTEVASVLMGFADSSNCFVVKYLNVRPSFAPLPQVSDTEPAAQQQMYMQPQYAAPPPMDDEGGEGRSRRNYRRQMPQQMMPTQPEATGPAPPETILRETPLYVTMVVDVVKLNAPPPPEAAKAPNAAGGRRGSR